MTYHGKVVGLNGQIYYCEHNHRTYTAAVTCGNSAATRRMAAVAFNRAAVQAAQAAALAKKREEERAAAEARRIAAREAAAARRAAAQDAAEEAKAAKRAAKLAAMSPRRAWKRMTPEERLLKTAEVELEAYGEIMSPDAKAAYDAHAAKRAAHGALAPSEPAPRTVAPPRAPVPLESVPPSPSTSSKTRLATEAAHSGSSPRPTGGARSGLSLVTDGGPNVRRPRDTPGAQPAAGESAGFGGDGLFVVGLDIRPGVYRTAGPTTGHNGYFALLKSTNTDDIVNNGAVRGPATITVGPPVKAVEVSHCQPWRRLGDNLDTVIAAANEPRSTASRD